MVITFVQLFESMIHQYRDEKYNDMRLVKRIYQKIEKEEEIRKKQEAEEEIQRQNTMNKLKVF
jgi:hypothetical protein